MSASSTDSIRQRLELANELPELVTGTAAERWRDDVTTLLLIQDQLEAEVEAWRSTAVELSERVALLEDQNERLTRALSHS